MYNLPLHVAGYNFHRRHESHSNAWMFEPVETPAVLRLLIAGCQHSYRIVRLLLEKVRRRSDVLNGIGLRPTFEG